MRKGTLLTSFVLDEITAQARYRNLLDEAAQRRLLKVAKTDGPSFFARFRLSTSDHLIAWGLRLWRSSES
jgi:hypothetical protein